MLNEHVPRRMRTASPARLPAGNAVQPSAVDAGVPERTSGNEPDVGGAGLPVAPVNPYAVPFTRSGSENAFALSIEPVAIAPAAVPGAPPDQRNWPGAPELPSDVTTTTPLL